MPDGIDPTVDQMKRASLEPTADSPSSNSNGKQLTAPNHAVLRFRQLSKRSINTSITPAQRTSFTFGPCEGLNVNLIRHEGPNLRLPGHSGRC